MTPSAENPLALILDARKALSGRKPLDFPALIARGWSPWMDEALSRLPSAGSSRQISEPFSSFALKLPGEALRSILDAFPPFLWAFASSGRSGPTRFGSEWIPESSWANAEPSSLSALASRLPPGFFPGESDPSHSLCLQFSQPRDGMRSGSAAFFGLLSSPFWADARQADPRAAAKAASAMAACALARACELEHRGADPSPALEWARAGAEEAAALDPKETPLSREAIGALSLAIALGSPRSFREGASLFFPPALRSGEEPDRDADIAWLRSACSEPTARDCQRFASDSLERVRSALFSPRRSAVRAPGPRQDLLDRAQSMGAWPAWRLALALSPSPQVRSAALEILGAPPPELASTASFPMLARPVRGVERMAATFRGAGEAKARAMMPIWIRQAHLAAESPLIPEALRKAILGESVSVSEIEATDPAWRKPLRRALRGEPFRASASILADWGAMAIVAGAPLDAVAQIRGTSGLRSCFDTACLILGQPPELSAEALSALSASELSEAVPDAPRPPRRGRVAL